jgi:lipopolysaccharide/colanic/teichoic acid biosynthesis glycosyltransferase
MIYLLVKLSINPLLNYDLVHLSGGYIGQLTITPTLMKRIIIWTRIWNEGEKLYRSGARPLIVFAVTVRETMPFLTKQIQYLIDSGFDVAVICSPGWNNETDAQYYPVKMEREIALCKDILSLLRIIKVLLFLKPDIINAGTPKASLLVGIAAFLTRVPIRIYMCHGLRLETIHGWKRKILFIAEWITCACATRICSVSNSVKNRLQELKLANSQKLDMIGFGSVNGINLDEFNPQQRKIEGEALFKKHSISTNTFVVGFVGRLTKDKGIPEAIRAFNDLKQSFPHIVLILVGKFEDGDPLTKEIIELIHKDPQIILTGFITNVKRYYHMFDVLWLPSHREGMPTVLLEAAASGVPVVACQTTGCIDAVDDGRTGYLVPVGDSKLLAAYTKTLLIDQSLAHTMGQDGRKRMEEHFNQQKVWENSKKYYQKLLAKKTKDSTLYQLGGGKGIKRIIDIGGALVGLIVFFPIMILVGFLVCLNVGYPVIFKQVRPGLYGRPIYIYKFRTMTEETDEFGKLLPDYLRITPFGNLLRKTSLDELPQLFNVLAGHISLVGPRPLLMEYLPLYSVEQARRHDVKSGITGWAQVNGRNQISWEEKFKLDVWYVDHQCFGLDMKILWMTLVKVCKREGISQQGHVTMKEFRGSEQWRDC